MSGETGSTAPAGSTTESHTPVPIAAVWYRTMQRIPVGIRVALLVALSLLLWWGIAWLFNSVWLNLGSLVSVDPGPPTARWPFLLLLPIAISIGWLTLWPRKPAEEPTGGGSDTTAVSDLHTRLAVIEKAAPWVTLGIDKHADELAADDDVRRGIIAGIQQTAERSLLEGPVVKHGRHLLVAAISVGSVIWLGGALWSGIQVQSVQQRATEATQNINLANENVRAVLDAASNRLALLDMAIALARDTVAWKRDSALGGLGTLAVTAGVMLVTTRDSVTRHLDSLTTDLDTLSAAAVRQIVAGRDAVRSDTLDIEATLRRIDHLNTLATRLDDIEPRVGRSIVESAYGRSLSVLQIAVVLSFVSFVTLAILGILKWLNKI